MPNEVLHFLINVVFFLMLLSRFFGVSILNVNLEFNQRVKPFKLAPFSSLPCEFIQTSKLLFTFVHCLCVFDIKEKLQNTNHLSQYLDFCGDSFPPKCFGVLYCKSIDLNVMHYTRSIYIGICIANQQEQYLCEMSISFKAVVCVKIV